MIPGGLFDSSLIYESAWLFMRDWLSYSTTDMMKSAVT